MLVQGKLLTNQDNLSDVYTVKRKVFIDELGCSETEVFPAYDMYAIHTIIYEGEKMRPVATGSILYDGSRCFINNIAVLKEYRKKGYGDFAIRMLIGKAFQSGMKSIYLKTNPDCIEFFKKFGFRENLDKNSESVSYIKDMVLHEEWYITGCNRK